MILGYLPIDEISQKSRATFLITTLLPITHLRIALPRETSGLRSSSTALADSQCESALADNSIVNVSFLSEDMVSVHEGRMLRRK